MTAFHLELHTDLRRRRNIPTHVRPSIGVRDVQTKDLRAPGRRPGSFVSHRYFPLLISYKQPERILAI